MQGRRMTENRMTMLVREYIRAADIGDCGSCHAFRHSIATAMLDNGADIRHVQAQLGTPTSRPRSFLKAHFKGQVDTSLPHVIFHPQ